MAHFLRARDLLGQALTGARQLGLASVEREVVAVLYRDEAGRLPVP
jgi:hypothetical protein